MKPDFDIDKYIAALRGLIAMQQDRKKLYPNDAHVQLSIQLSIRDLEREIAEWQALKPVEIPEMFFTKEELEELSWLPEYNNMVIVNKGPRVPIHIAKEPRLPQLP